MSLTSGTRLGSYQVEGAIGAGGMGEVYRARDTSLGRDVALKLLPELFARDPDRLARFEREAHMLASLNHPNIAQIYGFDPQAAQPFLVLELVEGETLADRLAAGPILLAEARAIAMQIADALEAAHERGIIHRDLKPANIKLRDDGTVKVLDFGLAKALDPVSASPAPGSTDFANSPTLSAHATELGFILGTAAYMAPEQAKGRTVDRRADIWAFGVVLFEMLTGSSAFTGESASEVMASVMKDAPDWSRLPADLPDPMRRLLRRCLEKDPRKRLSAIADARLELLEPPDRPAAGQPARRRLPLLWLAASALGGAALMAAGWLLLAPMLRAPADSPVLRVSVLGPDGVTLAFDSSEMAISPDGRSIVFTALDPSGGAKLWLRPLDALEARPIAGTDRASLPFWSPDSRQIGFFADGKLKKVPAAGGIVEVLCDAKDGRGAAWGSQGVIVFAPGNAGPLQSVPANGGKPKAATALDTTRGETGHRFPWFLPDGRHFVFVALPPREQKFDVYAGSLDDSARQFVTSTNGAPVYAEPGYLLFPRNNTLIAQRFDAAGLKLAGEPVVIGDAPGALGWLWSGSRAVSVSATGVLAYHGDRLANTKLEWFERSGRDAGAMPLPEGHYQDLAFSPDGRRLAMARYVSVNEADIWMVDLERGAVTRFTYGPAVNNFMVWSPDGSRVAFASDRSGARDLFVKAASGAAPEEPLYTSTSLFKQPTSWSADGKWLLFDDLDPQTNGDLWILPVEGDRRPVSYLRTPFNERSAQLSPDGRWVAYSSDESGRPEIYVDTFPKPGHKYRVTDNGGATAAWRKDGKELAILSLDGRSVLSADVAAGAEFRATAPRPLLTLPGGTVFAFPTPDMTRLLAAVPSSANTTSSLTLVFDWTGALAR